MHCYEEFTGFYRLLLNHCYKVAMYSESSGRNQTEWLPEIKPAPHLSILKIPVCSKWVHETWCIAVNHCILSASSYWIVFAVPTKSQKGVLGRTYWYKTASITVHCYLQHHLQNDTSIRYGSVLWVLLLSWRSWASWRRELLCITIN